MLRTLSRIDEMNDEDDEDDNDDDRQREQMTSPTSSTCRAGLTIEVAENNTLTPMEETRTTTTMVRDEDIDDEDDSFLFSFDFRQKQFYLPDGNNKDDDDDDHIIHIRHSHTWEEEGEIVRHSCRCENGDNFNIDEVYVAVENTVSSAEALVWTLRHGGVAGPSTVLYLVHVYPRTRNIPTLLGKFPIDKVNPQQVQKYLIQERNKRRQLLQSFLDVCSIFKVKAEIMMIESDMVAQAILELISIVNIRKLILGTTKPTTFCHRKSTKPHKYGKIGIAHQVLQHAPDSCDVVVICHGKPTVSCQLVQTMTPSPRAAALRSPKADSGTTRARNWLSRFNIFTIPAAGRGRLTSGTCSG